MTWDCPRILTSWSWSWIWSIRMDFSSQCNNNKCFESLGFLRGFCSLLHLNVLTGQWLDIRSSGPWRIGGFYTLRGFSVTMLWPGSQWVSAAMVLEELVLTTVDSVPRSQGVDMISTVDHQELVNLVQKLSQCILCFACVLCWQDISNREGLPKKTAVLLDFVQITATLPPPSPPPPNLDNLYHFF